MAYIEPCCAERQLPVLIRESRGFCFFQTAGDVTIEKLYQATASLVSNEPKTMLLVVPEADLSLMRFLAYAFRRKWLCGLLLLTQTAQTTLVEAELQDYLAAVHYAADPMVLDGLCVIVNEELKMKNEELPHPQPLPLEGRGAESAQGGNAQLSTLRSALPLATSKNSQLNKALILQGPVLSHTDPSVCQYVACLTTSNDLVRQATDAVVAKLRLKPIIDHSDNEALAAGLKRQFV